MTTTNPENPMLTSILNITDTGRGVRGDDLIGVIEATQAVIGDHALRLCAHNDDICIARTRTGGTTQAVYGNAVAATAARKVRKEAIARVAEAVDHADRILGTRHPLAQYITTLRDACGPSVYRTVDAKTAERLSARGCDLRRDVDLAS